MQSYDRYEMNNREKAKYLLITATALLFIGYVFYHNMIISILLSFAAIPGIRLYKDFLIEKRKNALKEQFRDLLYSLSASISAGRQMAEALKEANENLLLIYREDSLMIVELSYMLKRIFESRESEEEILKDFARRSGLEDIKNFVDIYFTCRTIGGDLVKVTGKTTDIIMDKMAIEKEIHMLTSQKRFEAKLLTAIPFILILFLQTASPDYFNIMYECLAGRLIMTAALLGIGVSYYLSIKLVKIVV